MITVETAIRLESAWIWAAFIRPSAIPYLSPVTSAPCPPSQE